MAYFVSLAYSLIFTSNPFTVTLNLLIISFLVSISAINLINKWVGFSLLLFYLGGIIILFIYLVSIVIVEKLAYYSKLPLYFLLTRLAGLLLTYDPWLPVQEIWGVSSIYSISALIIPLVTVILLLALLAVVVITGASKGPLKSLVNA